jgi:hypothetical protein
MVAELRRSPRCRGRGVRTSQRRFDGDLQDERRRHLREGSGGILQDGLRRFDRSTSVKVDAGDGAARESEGHRGHSGTRNALGYGSTL